MLVSTIYPGPFKFKTYLLTFSMHKNAYYNNICYVLEQTRSDCRLNVQIEVHFTVQFRAILRTAVLNYAILRTAVIMVLSLQEVTLRNCWPVS